MIEWIKPAWDLIKLADEELGDTCPKCGKSSIWLQEDKGTTWFTGKVKIQCGHCGHVFKVKRED